MFVCRNCERVYMSRSSWFCVGMFFFIYTVECMYKSECVYEFMYLYACNPTRERERERDREREREISPWRAI